MVKSKNISVNTKNVANYKYYLFLKQNLKNLKKKIFFGFFSIEFQPFGRGFLNEFFLINRKNNNKCENKSFGMGKF